MNAIDCLKMGTDLLLDHTHGQTYTRHANGQADANFTAFLSAQEIQSEELGMVLVETTITFRPSDIDLRQGHEITDPQGKRRRIEFIKPGPTAQTRKAILEADQ